MTDERSNTLKKLIEIISIRKPKIVFLENVKNFKTIHNCEPYNFLIEKLKEYGYFVKDCIMNTLIHSNIPQNRKRIFIVGFLDENVYNFFEFPLSKEKQKISMNY